MEQSTNLNQKLVEFIQRPGFKIDILLPNQNILEILYLKPNNYRIKNDLYEITVNLIKEIWNYVIHQFIKSIMKDRVPMKQRLLELITK